MRISDWSSDVCSSDLSERNKKAGAETSGRNIGCLASRALTCPVPEGEPHLPVLRNTRDPPSPWTGGAPGPRRPPAAPLSLPLFPCGGVFCSRPAVPSGAVRPLLFSVRGDVLESSVGVGVGSAERGASDPPTPRRP